MSPLSADASVANAQVHRALALQVAEQFLGAAGDAVAIGPLSSNYFSFTFSVMAIGAGGQRDVFVKIPKVDMRGAVPSILPITPGDRERARDEENSLRSLGHEWAGDDLDVRWIHLCGTVPEYNAIVTDRVFADDAISVLRRCDLRRRLGFRQDAQRLRRTMARLGAAVGRFHQTGSRTARFRLSEALPKLEFYCRDLASNSGSGWPERILRKLQALGDVDIAGIEAPTLKGLDIRNVLIDVRDRLHLLDPGRMKRSFRETDLARFIMTYRMLHWGSPGLLLFGEPDRRAELDFLDAYSSEAQPPSRWLLNFYLVKEQLKHWHNILEYVRRCNWPKFVKKLTVPIYVNPFFSSLLERESANIHVLGRSG